MKRCYSYQINNKLYLPKDFDKLLRGSRNILETDYSSRSPAEILNDIQNQLGCFFQLKYISPDSYKLRVFRVSNWFINLEEKEILSRNIISFHMPPIDKCIVNRANIDNKQVFYCSTDLITAYEEFELKYGELFFVSIWEFDGGGLTYADYTYGQKGKYDSANVFAEINEFLKEDVDSYTLKCMDFINRFFAQLFAINYDRLTERDRYFIPASIAYKDMFKDDCAAVIYPSVKDISKGINYAIRSDVANERLHPIKVLACLFDSRTGPETIKFDIRAIGDIAGQKIEWESFNPNTHTPIMENLINMRYNSNL